MSVVSVSVVSTAALIYVSIGVAKALLLAVGMVTVSHAADRAVDRMLENTETRELMKTQMLGDIASWKRRLRRAAGAGGLEGSMLALMSEFEKLEKSFCDASVGKEDLTAAAGEFSALTQRVCEAELDESQRAHREESIRRIIEEFRSQGVSVYAEALARIEGDLGKIAALPEEARMPALQGILEELREMERMKDLASGADISALTENRVIPGALPKSETEDLERVVLEIRDWADRIAQMDEEEGEKLRPTLEKLSADTKFPNRLARLRGQLRARWGALRERVATTAFFRETLTELMGSLGEMPGALDSEEGRELILRFEALCAENARYIERTGAMRLYEDIASFIYGREKDISEAFFVQKLQSALEEMGYELVSDETEESDGSMAGVMLPDRAHCLESPYDGYRMMLRVGADGALTTRLARAVASEEEKDVRAADQDAKDLEAGKKFCRDFDGVLKKMRESGLVIRETLRKEPGETDVIAVVDKTRNRAKKRRRGRKSGDLREAALPGREGESE
ncbi:MAG: hypothetical protein LBQ19_06575 [Synergistaceae bacterium]|jgi:hypothetical protein|nr:hypothetical protein [Synergistaceae bacterium]